MSGIFTSLQGKLKSRPKRRIVFPEATDERVLKAASRLAQEGLIIPVLIGKEDAIHEKARELSVDIGLCDIQDPTLYENIETMKSAFIDRRSGRVSTEEASIVLNDANYFGTMLVHLGEADGLVSGAAHSTSDTVRPALQIIKTKQGIKKTSGVFIMVRNEEKYVFADCAINIVPTSEDLAEIAVESAKTAKLFGIDPRIAMLSFSTKGSAKSEETERVKNAVAFAKEKDADLVIDGEMQFDAAFVPSVALKKAPNSTLKGEANVFIFPSLEAGNIGYKMTERLAGFEAVGPILQGLNRPVNDL